MHLGESLEGMRINPVAICFRMRWKCILKCILEHNAFRNAFQNAFPTHPEANRQGVDAHPLK